MRHRLTILIFLIIPLLLNSCTTVRPKYTRKEDGKCERKYFLHINKDTLVALNNREQADIDIFLAIQTNGAGYTDEYTNENWSGSIIQLANQDNDSISYNLEFNGFTDLSITIAKGNYNVTLIRDDDTTLDIRAGSFKIKQGEKRALHLSLIRTDECISYVTVKRKKSFNKALKNRD